MTELDGVGVTTMFAADAEFDVFFRFAAFFDGDLHEFADAGLVEAGEWVFLEDLILGVGIEEGSHIVAADSESGLSEIVGAEAEELRGLGDFIRSDRATRDFDHGADEVVKFDFLLGHHGLGDAVDNFNLEVEFFLEADERDHDLWLNRMDADRLASLWRFGRLIANTDMHYGNAALVLSERSPLRLAPVYDMLPMAYRPGAENMLPGLSEEAIALARTETAATPERELAAKFWKIVSNADQVSETFRQISRAHAAALRS